MTESPLERLTFKTKLTVQDALVQLSQATGFSDQQLMSRMPKLKDCSGVTLRTIPENIPKHRYGTEIVFVSLDGVNGHYAVRFPTDSGPEVYDDTDW